ncbi:hypothetical protein WT11_19955 [Burkholderia stagnalis]|uniref:hypothetical protein n=1 Tax=Burkholderia stagnalis TaxID=1503054 RepID=UPI00075C8AFC|nr:hypothetical protein [Burkholderia stagnalis]KVN32186.1 hypothetical protein WT11_19955 [Burkholderia stagnalis]
MTTTITRRRLLGAGALAGRLALSGCFTPKLFDDKQYTEGVSRFMITEDGRKLVVLGERYHSIFDMPDKLRPVLMSHYRKSLRSSFYGFHVDGDAVTGAYHTTLPKDASADDRQAAIADRFKERTDSLSLGGQIGGKRYSADGFEQKPDAAAQPFNRHYTVAIRESLSPVDKGIRLLATPVTVAADGVLVLGGILLVPVVAIAIQANGGLRIIQ